MPEIIPILIILVFTFGTSIFYFLSLLERSVLKLAFDHDDKRVENADVDFVHRAIKRLIFVLPPTFGVVILAGSILLVIQGMSRS